MALWTESSSSTLQLEAMDTSSSARPTYPLKDKVFHADIQIKSIEDATRDDEEYTQGNRLLEENGESHQDADNRKQAAEMQMYWDEAIAKNMNLPDGYSKVAVLLIKWADELDELKTRSEAEELETVFRERFHYHTETVELNVKSKPQHQMNSYMSRFIETHDGANHLLIIYYTGHGVYREDRKHLELTASTNPASRKGFDKEARANWNKAEDLLRSEDVEGDVLTILDTCYSSNLAKSGKEETRTFELLSASAIDITTAAPGENSFTRALIDALHELLNDFGDRPFTTFHLNQRILLNPRRHDTPSVLWFRLQHNERHIRLAPLKPEKDRERQKSLLRHPARGYLTLRFALRDDYLTQAQIEFLTKNLAKAFNNKALVGLRRIDWMGIRPARNTHFGRAALAIFAIAQWKRFLKKRREEKLLQRAVDQVEFPFQMSIDCTTSSTRKRSREENDDLPDPKREYLDKPPSPPVSDSSLLEDMELNVPITQSPMAYFPSNS